MCQSKAQGGRRCPGKGRNNGSHNNRRTAGIPTAAGMGEDGQGSPGATGSRVDGRSNRGSASLGLLVDGREVKVIAQHVPNSRRAAVLAERGNPTPVLYELAPEEAGVFRDAINSLREGNKYASSVYVYDEDEYADIRLLMTDDGKAGIAIKDGNELVSVFSRQDSVHSGCGNSLVAQSVELGVTHLDCYDTVLPRLYAEEGFLPVARMEWNDEYAPDDWEYETYTRYNNGRPDVVFMKHSPAAIDTRYVTLEEDNRGIYVEEYDEGIRLAS